MNKQTVSAKRQLRRDRLRREDNKALIKKRRQQLLGGQDLGQIRSVLFTLQAGEGDSLQLIKQLVDLLGGEHPFDSLTQTQVGPLCLRLYSTLISNMLKAKNTNYSCMCLMALSNLVGDTHCTNELFASQLIDVLAKERTSRAEITSIELAEVQWIYSNVLRKNLECLQERHISEMLCVLADTSEGAEEETRLRKAKFAGLWTMLTHYPHIRDTHKIYLIDLVKVGIDMLELESPAASNQILQFIKLVIGYHQGQLTLAKMQSLISKCFGLLPTINQSLKNRALQVLRLVVEGQPSHSSYIVGHYGGQLVKLLHVEDMRVKLSILFLYEAILAEPQQPTSLLEFLQKQRLFEVLINLIGCRDVDINLEAIGVFLLAINCDEGGWLPKCLLGLGLHTQLEKLLHREHIPEGLSQRCEKLLKLLDLQDSSL